MSNITAAIQSIKRTSGSANATITFQPTPVPQVFAGSTIKINNRLNGGYLALATVTSVVDPNTVIVTGLSAEVSSVFVIPDDALGAVAIIINTYPQT